MVNFQGSITVNCSRPKDQKKLESALAKVNPDIRKQIEQSDVNVRFYNTDGVGQAFADLYSESYNTKSKYFEQGLLQTKKGFVKHVLEKLTKYIKS